MTGPSPVRLPLSVIADAIQGFVDCLTEAHEKQNWSGVDHCRREMQQAANSLRHLDERAHNALENNASDPGKTP